MRLQLIVHFYHFFLQSRRTVNTDACVSIYKLMCLHIREVIQVYLELLKVTLSLFYLLTQQNAWSFLWQS